MTWLVLTVILGIIGIIALMVGFMGRAGKKEAVAKGGPYDAFADNAMIGWGFGISAVCLLLWILISMGMSIHTVGQRQVGIVYNFSGTITGKKDPGVVMTMPWQHIKKENVGLQREDFDLSSANSAVSQDQQSIFARVTVNYQVRPDKVVELFKTVGPAWKQTLLDSRLLQDFKEVTAGYTAAEITTKRPEMRAATKKRLEEELKPYDIKVVDFFVTNVGYSKAYETAIDAKNVQVQRALQAEAKVQQARAEGEQAKANAAGKAAANRILARSITPELIRLKSIEKLNPNVQVIYVPAGAQLFLPSTQKGG